MSTSHDVEESAEIEPKVTNAQKMKALPWGIAFNVANSIFAQFTFFGSMYVLFLSEVGLSKTEIGFLLSLFPFIDSIAIFIAPFVARFGYKRTFLAFFSLRKIISMLLLLTPWILLNYGSMGVFIFLAGVMITFSICRSTAFTAFLPWKQEHIPHAIRGKYSATNNIYSSLAGLLAIAIAGYVVDQSSTLNRFTLLFAIGVPFGFASVWATSFIPGGAPIKKTKMKSSSSRGMLAAIRDRSFLSYLAGTSMITLAIGPLAVFLPLFMQERVGLSSGNVIFLQTSILLGGLASSYLWGWATDRYGGKPVMVSGAYLIALLPILWLVMPRLNPWSFSIAMGIAFLQGIANTGRGIGSDRLLFVSVVPSEMKNEYMALFYAWNGLILGLSQLISGRLLDYFSGVSGRLFFIAIEPYTILFAASFVILLLSGIFLRHVRADSSTSVGRFVGLFFHGNPLRAFNALIRYQLAKDERSIIHVTERLGLTKSALTIDELLETLSDPRFYVRFESIVAIARRRVDERLMDALIRILKGNDPALSVVAAWALGRIGDGQAIKPLRAALDAPYRSIQAHAARSLGSLGDLEIAPLLIDRLTHEKDHGLQVAYSSALGKFGANDAIPKILSLLRIEKDKDTQMELSLDLARFIGDEKKFIQLIRSVREDASIALSKSVVDFRRKVKAIQFKNEDIQTLMDDSAEAFTLEDLEYGITLVCDIVETLPKGGMDEPTRLILQDSANQMHKFGIKRIEYTLLALHTLNVASFSLQP